MLINSINTFYSTVWVQKCSSIILCQFEGHRSGALPENAETRNLLRNIPRNFFKSLKTDSKQLQMTQTYPSRSLRTFVNVIKLIWYRKLKLAQEDVLDPVLKDSLLKSGCLWLSIILKKVRMSQVKKKIIQIWQLQFCKPLIVNVTCYVVADLCKRLSRY